jgi:DNA modification methylase
LDAQRKGAPCKWYDETKKVENVIRPGHYGIYKIIPGADQHPTEKPPELAAHFIGLHTQPGELVLDPFMGSGSTGLAAIRLGRKFLGIETDQHWFDVSCRKIETELSDREAAAYMETIPAIDGGASFLPKNVSESLIAFNKEF